MSLSDKQGPLSGMTPSNDTPLGRPIRFHRLQFWWLRIRFSLNNSYTVDLDSPTWKEELDNIIEMEAEKHHD